eukprot:CAMPEP_0206245602 /NCGR_PEP_ID=MMETSP0047_2-20121206/18786_1 /ASSEMBLY_ACC=CAM_ASM_000192 /TAXON_ID=195065 /ORGANISM="Chroomonas mesostigmatica_cf, Strain CCMP1168" /LENGTH=298 /DNA_ID=CAMNT_0053670915 /DNA_START=1 /DNA_END=897 /DNA_ORIENTATION=+
MTVAVLFASSGGMGDVGKCAVMQALNMEQVNVRPLSLSFNGHGGGQWRPVDVADQHLQAEVNSCFRSFTYPIKEIDVGDPGAQAKLEAELQGVDVVVACLGHRQMFRRRWMTKAAQQVVTAMEKKGVTRLVLLSSAGVGNDNVRRSLPGAAWRGIRRLANMRANSDLRRMENVVKGTNLDYALIRPVDFRPECEPKGVWKLVRSVQDGPLARSISKFDVSAFMLQEALDPSVSRDAVTIGQDFDEVGREMKDKKDKETKAKQERQEKANKERQDKRDKDKKERHEKQERIKKEKEKKQ